MAALIEILSEDCVLLSLSPLTLSDYTLLSS